MDGQQIYRRILTPLARRVPTMKAKDMQKWREEHGHSQASLAAALEISSRQIMRYEMGEQVIPKAIELAMRSVPDRKGGGRWPGK